MPGDIVGRKVLNRYKILEKLGGGGMSVVWKAYDLVLDRNVALKILRPEMSEDEDFIRRFRREAQSVASLSHSNIVNIYDVGEDRGLYFIVMELIEGQTLRDKLKADGKIDVPQALEIAGEICEALAHAHAHRIIHRDIKPQNILLTKQGHVKVADFGIARALGGISTTSKDVVVGSAPYISPEQAKNGIVSTRSDLYSLGVVMYEMLSGKPPFAGDSPVAVALQHVEADPPSLREKYPSVPKAVDDLVKKAMAKDPNDRFQSAEEMLQAIKTVQAGGSLDEVVSLAPDPGGDANLKRAGKKRKEIPLPAKVLIGLAVAATLTIAYALWVFSRWMNVPVVEVPDVVGRSQVEAQKILKDAGFVFQISGERYDDKAPAGTVLTQSPQGGEKVKQGREVYCLLSKGQDFARVPDVRGMDRREVDVAFENAGLVVGNVTYAYSSTVEKGKVISQNPYPNVDLPRGSQVSLVLSNGPEPEKVLAVVPNVVGMTLDAAKKALNDALLDPGEISYKSGQGTEGQVISQDPPANTEVPVRSKVALVIAGKDQVEIHQYTKSFTVPKDASPDGKPVRVRISVTDLRGETVIYDAFVDPGSSRSVAFAWQGPEATLKIDIGGKVTTEKLKP